jgi:chromosome segregation ATPase
LIKEQKKYQLALTAWRKKHQQALAEERSMYQQALEETQDKHQQESDRRLRQKEKERDEYIARLDTLSARLAEADDRSRKNESHLSLVIKDLSAAFDRKRSEHAHVLADLEAYRDLSERQADELQEIETHHKELQADVWRKVAIIDDLNREINAHKQQVEHLHAVLVERDQQDQAVMAQISAFHASRSWRMTRPFRVAKRFFSKLRNVLSSD